MSQKCQGFLSKPSIDSNNKESIYLIYVYIDNIEVAKDIATSLLSNKLAACINIVPKVISFYEFEGNSINSEENLIIIKTLKKSLKAAMIMIKKMHTYKVPAIMAIKVTNVDNRFKAWIKEQVK